MTWRPAGAAGWKPVDYTGLRVAKHAADNSLLICKSLTFTRYDIEREIPFETIRAARKPR